MSQGSEFREKIDFLDLIITVLKDHEKVLDELIKKLEPIVSNLGVKNTEGVNLEKGLSPIKKETLGLDNTSSMEVKMSELNNTLTKLIAQPSRSAIPTSIHCSEWEDFKARSVGAHTVAYDVKAKNLIITSNPNSGLHTYSEHLPECEFEIKKDGEHFILNQISVDNLEDLPLTFTNRLNCGLEVSRNTSRHKTSNETSSLKVTYEIDNAQTIDWLSKELSITKERILKGEISV